MKGCSSGRRLHPSNGELTLSSARPNSPSEGTKRNISRANSTPTVQSQTALKSTLENISLFHYLRPPFFHHLSSPHPPSNIYKTRQETRQRGRRQKTSHIATDSSYRHMCVSVCVLFYCPFLQQTRQHHHHHNHRPPVFIFPLQPPSLYGPYATWPIGLSSSMPGARKLVRGSPVSLAAEQRAIVGELYT